MARTPRKWQGARTPSGLKRVRQAERRRAILQPRRSAAKTLVAKALTTATVEPAGADVATSLSEAISALDRAAKAGAIHPNAAARRKSRLARKVNAAVGGSTVRDRRSRRQVDRQGRRRQGRQGPHRGRQGRQGQGRPDRRRQGPRRAVEVDPRRHGARRGPGRGQAATATTDGRQAGREGVDDQEGRPPRRPATKAAPKAAAKADDHRRRPRRPRRRRPRPRRPSSRRSTTHRRPGHRPGRFDFRRSARARPRRPGQAAVGARWSSGRRRFASPYISPPPSAAADAERRSAAPALAAARASRAR